MFGDKDKKNIEDFKITMSRFKNVLKPASKGSKTINVMVDEKELSEKKDYLHDPIHLYDRWFLLGFIFLLGGSLLALTFNKSLPGGFYLVGTSLILAVLPAIFMGWKPIEKNTIYLIYRFSRFIGIASTEGDYLHPVKYLNKLERLSRNGIELKIQLPVTTDGQEELILTLTMLFEYNLSEIERLAKFLPAQFKKELKKALFRSDYLEKCSFLSLDDAHKLLSSVQNSELPEQFVKLLKQYHEVGYIVKDVSVDTNPPEPIGRRVFEKSLELETSNPFWGWSVLLPMIALLSWGFSASLLLSFLLGWFFWEILKYFYVEVEVSEMAVIWLWGLPHFRLMPGKYWIPFRVEWYSWEKVDKFLVRPKVENLADALLKDFVELKERIAHCSSLAEAQKIAQEFFYEVKEEVKV
ncbi:hypothetical protein HY061_02650 [Candidatus Azambacteria bacterium]|nr:hypothetical protein [Candidatus Azambacteria bacterium]